MSKPFIACPCCHVPLSYSSPDDWGQLPLYSAAPELLIALETAMRELPPHFVFRYQTFQLIGAALAKARGDA